MTYAEKLKDPKWQRKRLEILQRDDFSCFYCGDKESTLHVHHEFYEKGKEPWEYDDYVLTTLCEDCHSIDHLMKTPLEKYMLTCLRSRAKNNNEDIKLLNRVLRSVSEDGGYE